MLAGRAKPSGHVGSNVGKVPGGLKVVGKSIGKSAKMTSNSYDPLKWYCFDRFSGMLSTRFRPLPIVGQGAGKVPEGF